MVSEQVGGWALCLQCLPTPLQKELVRSAFEPLWRKASPWRRSVSLFFIVKPQRFGFYTPEVMNAPSNPGPVKAFPCLSRSANQEHSFQE